MDLYYRVQSDRERNQCNTVPEEVEIAQQLLLLCNFLSRNANDSSKKRSPVSQVDGMKDRDDSRPSYVLNQGRQIFD